MFPIIVCSVMAVAIILERLWTLQEKRVLPRHITRDVWEWVSGNQLNHEHLQALHDSSPLGEILAVGLTNRHRNREIMKERIEDTGRHVVHELERYLNSLGTIDPLFHDFAITVPVGKPYCQYFAQRGAVVQSL